jgi:spermidine/putrescine transport system substrate-binding protein
MNFEAVDPSGHRRPMSHLSRRRLLQSTLWMSAAAGVAPLLSACGGGDDAPAASGESGAPYPLARPDSPVTLPIKDSNPPIADGLDPENGGVFRILNYDSYMAPGVMKAFGKKHDVDVQVTPYNNYDEMLSKIRAPGESFDLVFPGPSQMSKMVYTDLIQPLNHSYVPHLANVWPEFQDPWYDQGARYTVPYTIYTTGVVYRTDRVSSVPDNGYDLFWDTAYAGKSYILDDMQEAIGMSLLRNDITTDINTGDASLVQQATDSLIELIDSVNIKVNINAYSEVPEGTATVHQGWSGDVIAGQYYLPKGQTPDVLGYWVPEDPSQRVAGSDCIAIPASSEKPVLAHMFLNDLLDNDISLRNFGWNGYQPPITKLSADYLVAQGYIPENLTSAVVVREDIDTGLTFYEVAPSTEAIWRQSWSKFKAGA